MPTYNISLNPELAEVVEREIKAKKYANRSEFFRDLVRTHYFERNTLLAPDEEITVLDLRDPDYALLEQRKHEATIPFSKVLHRIQDVRAELQKKRR